MTWAFHAGHGPALPARSEWSIVPEWAEVGLGAKAIHGTQDVRAASARRLLLCPADLVGGTGIEPVASSASGKVRRVFGRGLVSPKVAMTCRFRGRTCLNVAAMRGPLALSLALCSAV